MGKNSSSHQIKIEWEITLQNRHAHSRVFRKRYLAYGYLNRGIKPRRTTSPIIQIEAKTWMGLWIQMKLKSVV